VKECADETDKTPNRPVAANRTVRDQKVVASGYIKKIMSEDAGRIDQLRRSAPLPEGDKALIMEQHDIEVRNVDFSYRDTAVLKDVRLHPGCYR
jgi:ABC-type multidrug transport system fused ATPase/permease subunit